MKAWRRGHQAAARRQQQLTAAEGPREALAVAEALAALAAIPPGPRDPVAERAVEVVRRRWARIERRARKAQKAR